MKREVISSVVAGCALFVVIVMVSRSGSSQSSISDCKEPFGNPPCNANSNATFNDGKNRGARLNFTGYAVMVLVTVPYLTHAQTLTVKDFAPAAALRMATEFRGKTYAQMW